ncbi:MAG: HupE/UreJ family protein, partial [Rhodobacteraceae bacterium]|nr:HupE/UreJ family protein [Paracoccaceae bacterium]
MSHFWYIAAWLLAGLVVWAAAIPVAMAHESRPAYLKIDETAPGQYSMVWRTPVKAGQRLPVVLQVPDNARNLQDPVIMELADSRLERRRIDAGPEGLGGKRIEFPGLQYTITDVVV